MHSYLCPYPHSAPPIHLNLVHCKGDCHPGHNYGHRSCQCPNIGWHWSKTLRPVCRAPASRRARAQWGGHQPPGCRMYFESWCWRACCNGIAGGGERPTATAGPALQAQCRKQRHPPPWHVQTNSGAAGLFMPAGRRGGRCNSCHWARSTPLLVGAISRVRFQAPPFRSRSWRRGRPHHCIPTLMVGHLGWPSPPAGVVTPPFRFTQLLPFLEAGTGAAQGVCTR